MTQEELRVVLAYVVELRAENEELRAEIAWLQGQLRTALKHVEKLRTEIDLVSK